MFTSKYLDATYGISLSCESVEGRVKVDELQNFCGRHTDNERVDILVVQVVVVIVFRPIMLLIIIRMPRVLMVFMTFVVASITAALMVSFSMVTL